MSKHRSIIYVVVRHGGPMGTIVLDSFFSYEAADDRRGAYEQQFAEIGATELSFQVQSSCFYDE